MQTSGHSKGPLGCVSCCFLVLRKPRIRVQGTTRLHVKAFVRQRMTFRRKVTRERREQRLTEFTVEVINIGGLRGKNIGDRAYVFHNRFPTSTTHHSFRICAWERDPLRNPLRGGTLLRGIRTRYDGAHIGTIPNKEIVNQAIDNRAEGRRFERRAASQCTKMHHIFDLIKSGLVGPLEYVPAHLQITVFIDERLDLPGRASYYEFLSSRTRRQRALIRETAAFNVDIACLRRRACDHLTQTVTYDEFAFRRRRSPIRGGRAREQCSNPI